jgi:MOSC domain-containing protein
VSADRAVGTVRDLRRYPVKSLAGEALTSVVVDQRGVVGDRMWAVLDHDGKLGSGKSSRRFRKMDGLLRLTATLDGEVPVVGFPDGRRLRADELAAAEAMSAYVGRPVSLGREHDLPHHDEGPVHLVTTSSLAAARNDLGRDVPPVRMRPNLVLDTGPEPALLEDGWVGRRLVVGAEVVLDVRGRMERCVMVGLEQVDEPAEPSLLGTLAALNDTCLGVVLDVVRGGRVSVGDEVRLA